MRALVDMPAANGNWRAAAVARQANLTKPPGSLGRLEDVAIFLAGWGNTPAPACGRIKCAVFAGNHGVTRRGISPYPASVTKQMVANFANNGAAINALTRANGLDLQVLPLALDEPTGDISVGPAMSTEETVQAMSAGATTVTDDLDCLAVGEMGIGNTTIAATLATAVFGGKGADWAGPGTGLAETGVQHKSTVVDRAIERFMAGDQAPNGPSSKLATPIEIVRQLGGREVAAIAGAVLAARMKRIPVILDGFISTAAIAPFFETYPAIVDHVIAAHVSAEPAHRKLLDAMHLVPLLDLQLRLGEGTGAALAAGVIKAAVAAHNEMATFEQAGVSNVEGGGEAEGQPAGKGAI